MNMFMLKILALVSSATAAWIKQCVRPGTLALTFDEGPIVDYQGTEIILNMLKEKSVRATFHIVLEHMNNPDVHALARRCIDEGHLVGYRTEPTWNLNGMPLSEFHSKMNAAHSYFRNDLGLDLKFIRLPYIDCDHSSWVPVLEGMGYTVTKHNLDSNDYKDPDHVVQEFERRMDQVQVEKHSFISVQRASKVNSAKSVNAIIDSVRAKGYRFVDIEECLGYKNHTMPADSSFSPKKPDQDILDHFNDTVDAQTNSAMIIKGTNFLMASFTLVAGIMIAFL